MEYSDELRTVTLPGGVGMPTVGFGTWRIEGEPGYRALRAALDAGYRHIDTATMYGNEREVGRAVRDSGVPREQVFLTTKLPPGRADRARTTLEQSLHALGVDFVDLWLIHWPPHEQSSPQTWQDLLAARDDGRSRAVGVSNYSTAQLDELIKETGEAPAVNQIPYGPTRHDAAVLAQARERAVVVAGYSPLKNTDLRSEVLTRAAASHGVDVAQVVLRWHLQHGVVVLPKSQTPERISTNLDLFKFTLDSDEMRDIDSLGIDPGGRTDGRSNH